MQGLSVITDQQGKPKTVTIDMLEHDSQLSPLVTGLLELLQHQGEHSERADFRMLAHANLDRAYGEEEPDYSDVPAYTTRQRP